MRKGLFIVFTFSIILNLFFAIPHSRALEICLSNLPDSAWQNGEPEDVKKQLNFDLVGSVQILNDFSEPANFLNVLSQGSTNLRKETIYTYKGRNCSTRTIKIKREVQGPILNYSSRSSFELEVKKRSQNFIQEQSTLQLVDQIIEKIKKQAIFKIVNSDISTQQIYSSLEIRPSGRNQNILLNSNPEQCYFLISVGEIQSRIYSTGNSGKGGIPYFPIKLSSSRCKIDVDFYYPNTFYNFVTNKSENGSEVLYRLGEIYVEQQPEEDTITCVNKAKKILKVTSFNPKCPKGYSKKNN